MVSLIARAGRQPDVLTESSSRYQSKLFSTSGIEDVAHIRDLILLTKQLKCPSVEQNLLQRAEELLPGLTGFECLELAEVCSVGKWKVQGLAKICERSEPLSSQEGRILGYDTFAVVSRIREEKAKPPEHRSLLKAPSIGYCPWSVARALRLAGGELGIPEEHF